MAGFRGQVDGNEQQLVFQVVAFFLGFDIVDESSRFRNQMIYV